MKHTFTRQQVKQILLEELQADLLIENTTRQILEEGMFDTVKKLKDKFFPNKKRRRGRGRTRRCRRKTRSSKPDASWQENRRFVLDGYDAWELVLKLALITENLVMLRQPTLKR